MRPGDDFSREYLPTVCLDLRMSLTGAADPWPEDYELAAMEYLRDRLQHWHPCHSEQWACVDEAVRMLIVATLAEVTAMRARRAVLLAG